MAYKRKRAAGGKRKAGTGYRRKTTARKRAGANKKTPRYTKGSSMSMNDVNRQLAVYKNPFTTYTTNPKIPDGKATMSAGLRVQAVKDIKFSAVNETLHILLLPGCNNGAIILGNNGTAMTDKNMFYKNQVAIKTESMAPDLLDDDNKPITTSSTNTYKGEVGVIETGETKWRLVSQALKLTLVNNSDENDGWWEAIRTTCNAKSFGLVENNESSYYHVGFNSTTALPDVSLTDTIVENNTYASGKLRDIHRYLFQLHPTVNDHDFKSCVDIRTQPDQASMMPYLMDDSFDCIYIRVYGRSAADGRNPTRLMAHIVANQEVIYDEDEVMTRFHTETKRAGQGVLERTKDYMVRNNKAARLAYGGL